METFWRDIQYGMRTLGKNPGFAVIGIVTLALGMAVNTTIFSVVNGMLLRPMPVPHAEQLTVLALQEAGDKTLQNFSYPDFLDLRSQTEGFSDLFAYRVTLTLTARETTASWAESPTIIFPLWASLPQPDGSSCPPKD
jgi:hypothetical protein